MPETIEVQASEVKQVRPIEGLDAENAAERISTTLKSPCVLLFVGEDGRVSMGYAGIGQQQLLRDLLCQGIAMSVSVQDREHA